MLPLIATISGALFAGVVFRLYTEKRNPALIAWATALGLLALASACVFLGSLGGWTSLIAKTYYLSGATIGIGFLAAGLLYMLLLRTLAHIWLVFVLIISVMTILQLAGAGIDSEALKAAGEPGWKAIEIPSLLTVITGVTRTASILVLVVGVIAGAVYGRISWFGIIIAIGAVVSGAGSVFTFAGSYEFESLGMTAGMILIFMGVMKSTSFEEESAGV